MKKVLMITYYFPPLGGIGAQRTNRYIRYLPKFGWDPIVLTVKNGTLWDRDLYFDKQAVQNIPNDISIFRTRLIDVTVISKIVSRIPYIRRYRAFLHDIILYLPSDYQIGWLPFAALRGLKLVHKEKIDVIYSVSAPYTAHLVGYLLKWVTKKPWVADFRDEWTKHRFRKPRFLWQKMLDRLLEKKVLAKTDKIIAVTEPYRKEFQEILAPNSRDKVFTITNGFDINDFSSATGCNTNNELTISYVGLFYGTMQPTYFLLALKELLDEGQINPEFIKVNFVGPRKTFVLNQLEDENLKKIVNYTGFVPHRRAIEYIMNSDVLLLIASKGRGKENIPGKTFDYIASGRPILALAPFDGEAAKVIRESRTGIGVVEPEDIEAIKQAILSLYISWQKRQLQIEPDWNHIYRYEAQELTKNLCTILNEAILESNRIEIKRREFHL